VNAWIAPWHKSLPSPSTSLYSHSSQFTLCEIKVKFTLVQAQRLCTGRTAHRGSRGIALPFRDHGTRRGEGSASRPHRSLPPGNTRYPLYRRLGGPQGRSGQVRKISPPPPGFDPRTVQPVASSYTDYATQPTHVMYTLQFKPWNKSLTFRRLMSYIYGAPILDVSRSHTTTQHSR